VTKRFWLQVGAAAAVIMLGCWLSSGTMAAYGTYDFGPCHYRMNGDHPHFSAVFLMLDGQPSVDWDFSVVLRRVLHPLLAYPLMKVFGFEAGGLMFNILLHGGALIALGLAIRRIYDARAAVLVCWLFATYPGYAYWAGLPYSYAIIVPGCIACTIGLLWWHERPSVARAAIAATIVGVVGCGYDIMPFFGVALLLLAAHRRRWRDLAVSLVVLGVWAVFVARGLPWIFGFEASNSNTQTYGNVIGAWLHFFYSGTIFLPILFLLVVAHQLKLRVRPILGPVALAILLSTFAVFLFLNLAPPYGGYWQLRGTWLARLYQPWFVVILLAVAAASVALRDTRRYKVLVGAVVACCLMGGIAIAGPYIHVYRAYQTVNQNFYQDASLRKNRLWFNRLGVRPYGICKKK
jgi:hypothetical protein